MKKATVIGAGIGGLSAACLLANQGYEVTLYEKNSTPGGKMQEWTHKGYRFDTGPSLLTMPFQLEKLFDQCGESMSDYLELTEPDPLCRYFYPDGVIFDNYSDKEKNAEQIRQFAPTDVSAYNDFLSYSEKLYQRTSDAFLFNPLYNIRDLKNLNFFNLLKINAFTTVANQVDKSLSSPYLRQFFKRFTTYNGSSPFQAPATLNVIPHVELNLGGFYVKGGLYGIARALFRLGESLGVSFRFNEKVIAIQTENSKVTGLKLKNDRIDETDLVIANSDATDTLLHLISDDVLSPQKKKKQKKIEPSGSGFVMMLGSRKKWDHLKHHNIFFSSDYEKEFHHIFDEKRLPEDPTIYVANTSYTDTEDAPPGSSNLFVLVNAPYVNKNHDWKAIGEQYSEFLISELESRGLNGLEESLEFVELITPADFLEKYRSNSGSIYGTSSNNKFAAFLRPRNKLRALDNLYMVGGSTHPGGGIPLVIQSAFNALALINR